MEDDEFTDTYRGRCRHQHETSPARRLIEMPDLTALQSTIGARDPKDVKGSP